MLCLACYMCPKCLLRIAGKQNNQQFYSLNFLKFCDNISLKLLRPTQFLKTFLEIVRLAKINQAPPPSSMLQYIDRLATPKF